MSALRFEVSFSCAVPVFIVMSVAGCVTTPSKFTPGVSVLALKVEPYPSSELHQSPCFSDEYLKKMIMSTSKDQRDNTPESRAPLLVPMPKSVYDGNCTVAITRGAEPGFGMTYFFIRKGESRNLWHSRSLGHDGAAEPCEKAFDVFKRIGASEALMVFDIHKKRFPGDWQEPFLNPMAFVNCRAGDPQVFNVSLAVTAHEIFHELRDENPGCLFDWQNGTNACVAFENLPPTSIVGWKQPALAKLVRELVPSEKASDLLDEVGAYSLGTMVRVQLARALGTGSDGISSKAVLDIDGTGGSLLFFLLYAKAVKDRDPAVFDQYLGPKSSNYPSISRLLATAVKGRRIHKMLLQQNGKQLDTQVSSLIEETAKELEYSPLD